MKEKILKTIKKTSCTGTFAKGERSLMLTEPMYEHLASEIEAAHTYDNAAKLYYGEFANLNFK